MVLSRAGIRRDGVGREVPNKITRSSNLDFFLIDTEI